MSKPVAEADSWRRMVLQSMPPVGWLESDAPDSDVALSTRCRVMRNLVGRRFPHAARAEELRAIEAEVLDAARRAALPCERLLGVTAAERDYLVGSRLVSPDFAWQEPGRALLLDPGRRVAVMVNEEDHIRVQALTGGWSPEAARSAAGAILDGLAGPLEFAQAPGFGFLAASPHNCGSGRRLSAMFHLIGLAHFKRLPSILRALAEKRLAARGLFGEASRAVGAFVQVSVVHGTTVEFAAACDYLLREEREARARFDRAALASQLSRTLDFARAQRKLSLADALRVLAWSRWAACVELAGAPGSARALDGVLTKLELRSLVGCAEADEQRADYLRKALGL